MAHLVTHARLLGCSQCLQCWQYAVRFVCTSHVGREARQLLRKSDQNLVVIIDAVLCGDSEMSLNNTSIWRQSSIHKGEVDKKHAKA
jgi:hypothetical protein